MDLRIQKGKSIAEVTIKEASAQNQHQQQTQRDVQISSYLRNEVGGQYNDYADCRCNSQAYQNVGDNLLGREIGHVLSYDFEHLFDLFFGEVGCFVGDECE